MIVFSGGFMNEIKKKEIIGQNRHQFIYGYNNDERRIFLQGIENDFPIKVNENIPMAIYLDESYLAEIDLKNTDVDKFRMYSIGREQFNFVIGQNILNKILRQAENNLNEQSVEKFLSSINKLYLSSSCKNIETLDELLNVLKKSQKFYEEYYAGQHLDINELKIQFLDITSFIRHIKKLLNNNSYFNIIVDYRSEISQISKIAINALVASRINSDISMKVACEPGEWKVYTDFNGQHIDSIHDYGIVNLDNSEREYTRKLKNKFMEE